MMTIIPIIILLFTALIILSFKEIIQNSDIILGVCYFGASYFALSMFHSDSIKSLILNALGFFLFAILTAQCSHLTTINKDHKNLKRHMNSLLEDDNNLNEKYKKIKFETEEEEKFQKIVKKYRK